MWSLFFIGQFQVRKLRQELEEKSEMTMELQEELSEANVLLNKLRAENSELIQDARSARTYRDEVDILKEKVGNGLVINFTFILI